MARELSKLEYGIENFSKNIHATHSKGKPLQMLINELNNI